MLQNTVAKSFNTVSRGLSSFSRQAISGKLLNAKQANIAGRRLMSGHGPDISKTQAVLYILIGGGGFAAFGMYQTNQMRNRIEAFETGKMIPFKTLSEEDFLAAKERAAEEEED